LPLVLRNQHRAMDYQPLIENLRRFYDFSGKTVLLVGAGGGRLLDPSVKIKKLIAIDRDAEALEQLKANFAAKGMPGRVELVRARFEDVTSPADVVYFEFCLHEMADPLVALSRASTLAPDTVVCDHTADSDWSVLAAEDDKVRRSAKAIERRGIRRSERVLAEQHFRSHAELLAKLSPQGPTAIGRARRFVGIENIVVAMPCDLLLL
jgi:2-polyprenyl-3-methyl-5-hydroxy-6-metoxy-1,4-benzoquinol methylase